MATVNTPAQYEGNEAIPALVLGQDMSQNGEIPVAEAPVRAFTRQQGRNLLVEIVALGLSTVICLALTLAATWKL